MGAPPPRSRTGYLTCVKFRLASGGGGGQPTDEGWLWLKSQGVGVDVKLNTEKEGSDQTAKTIGMRVFPEPINFWQQMGVESMAFKGYWPDPNPLSVHQWFENIFIAIPDGNPCGTYVHCEHGQDRTGLFVAMYEVRFLGYTKEHAEQEMLENGFHKELRGLWDFWKGWQP